MTDGLSVLVCRGCCCGTVAKHPDVDHEDQLAALRAAVPPGGRLHVVDCLDTCERSNVVVVRRGVTRTWFGEVLGPSTTAALAAWLAGGATDAPPAGLAAQRFLPVAVAPNVAVRRLAWSPAEVRRQATSSLRSGAGAWTVGVHGAMAELGEAGGFAVHEQDGAVIAVAAQGALRLRPTTETAAFAVGPAADPSAVVLVVLAVPRRSLAGAGAPGVTLLGPDREAIRPQHRWAELVDLGLGRPAARFCVRTQDPAVRSGLADVAGLPLADVLEAMGPALRDAPAHRVVETAMARAEVYGPIPAPAGTSPSGPHTHLLPGLLELDLELPPGIRLPDGWAPAAVFHPPPSWSPPG